MRPVYDNRGCGIRGNSSGLPDPEKGPQNKGLELESMIRTPEPELLETQNGIKHHRSVRGLTGLGQDEQQQDSIKKWDLLTRDPGFWTTAHTPQQDKR